MENSIIGVGEAVVIEDTSREENSSNYQPPAGKPTKTGRNRRKRSAVNSSDALALIQSGISYFKKSGGDFAIVELPQRTPHAVGIVLSLVWACEKCRDLVYGEKSPNGKCVTCNG